MLKQSIKQYRNINGIHYQCYHYVENDYPEIIKECKQKKLHYRIIDGQFYIEVKKTELKNNK